MIPRGRDYWLTFTLFDISRLVPRGRVQRDSLLGVMYQYDSVCAIIGLPSFDIST